MLVLDQRKLAADASPWPEQKVTADLRRRLRSLEECGQHCSIMGQLEDEPDQTNLVIGRIVRVRDVSGSQRG